MFSTCNIFVFAPQNQCICEHYRSDISHLVIFCHSSNFSFTYLVLVVDIVYLKSFPLCLFTIYILASINYITV